MKNEAYARFNHTDLILRDVLAADRTLLAAERTALAYLRTAFTFIVAGITVVNFITTTIMATVAAFAVLTGLIVGYYGFQKYWHIKKEMIRLKGETTQNTLLSVSAAIK